MCYTYPMAEGKRKTSDAQLRATKKYNASNTKLLTVRLNVKRDSDIICFLENEKNKSALIKELIRRQMKGD